MYWSNHNGTVNSDDIETTAYALLALLKFDDFASSAKVVTWLTAQRDAIGVWRTTQVNNLCCRLLMCKLKVLHLILAKHRYLEVVGNRKITSKYEWFK